MFGRLQEDIVKEDKEDRDMEERNITIPVEEYKKLLEMSVRVSVFADYVNQSKYSIDREDCGRFLGFEVVKEED